MNVIASRWICCLLFAFSSALATAQSAPRGPVDARMLAARLHAGDAPPPSWLGDGGARAREAVRLLRDAPAHGLDPARYDAEGLAARLDAGSDEMAAPALERDLGTAMLQYLADLHFGRVASGYRVPSDAAPPFDPVDHLRRALRDGRLADAVDTASPPIPMVRRVEATLARYRALAAAHPHWPDLPPLPARRGEPGTRYAGTALLRERLRLLGDLDADASAGDVYTPDLAAAVRRFQARHGLAEDGVLGVGTLAALAVPPARRVTQLELTLERLRWLPRPPQGRVVVVDVPAYRLWAFDGRDPAGQLLEMRVIVGAAARTPTPLFIGQMRYLEFNPYWNVPRSIETAEIIPKLAREPGYLARNDMELVSAAGQVLPDAGALAALRAGTARVRQRPGPKNALGAVKFAMPNPMNIYLHSTSAQELFARSRRDLSHGCIRVEHPAALAQFVLADPARWNADAVAAALRPGRTVTVTLREPVPVVLFYATALTDRDGRALFTEDVYGLDEQLVQALRAD